MHARCVSERRLQGFAFACELTCRGTLTLVLFVFYPGNPVYSGHAKIINTQYNRVENLLFNRSLAFHSI
jgi:hypothetical protein